jgi:UDP-N-acetylglucosamine transferase subunit ALG13
MDFGRLIKAIDAIAENTGERIVVQKGMGSTMPKHCEHFDFKPREACMALQREARVVVAHAGIGCAIDALEAKRPLIIVPRRKEFEEHMDDHQLQIGEAIAKRGWGRVILEIGDLAEACATPPAVPESYETSGHRLVWATRDVVDRIAARKSAP